MLMPAHRATFLSAPRRSPRSGNPLFFMQTAAASLAIGACLTLAASPALAGGASGQTIGLTCVVCHGPGGQGTKTIPPLAGRSADTTYAALLAYKNGSRPSTVMDRHAKGYSDEELRAVAEYFASLPAK